MVPGPSMGYPAGEPDPEEGPEGAQEPRVSDPGVSQRYGGRERRNRRFMHHMGSPVTHLIIFSRLCRRPTVSLQLNITNTSRFRIVSRSRRVLSPVVGFSRNLFECYVTPQF